MLLLFALSGDSHYVNDIPECNLAITSLTDRNELEKHAIVGDSIDKPVDNAISACFFAAIPHCTRT